MSVKLRAAITILLTATGVWAQSPAPLTAPADKPAVVGGEAARSNRLMGRPFPGRRPGIQTQLPERQRLQEMQTTLTSMHALLKEMRDKAASRNSKDAVVKDNLQMWELMLAHLDKQLDQLKIATLMREDLDARRADLYNQASEKAAKEAQSAAGQTPPAPSTVPKE
jgi:hypothetical protein